MRLTFVICCLLLTACGAAKDAYSDGRGGGAGDGAQAQSVASDAAPDRSSAASKAAHDDEVSPTMDALWALPESKLQTECSAADSYPDHQLKPDFYGYPRPPEFERYAQCLLAEARRDGGSRRLASPKSFPRIGTCYDTEIVEIGSRFGDGSDGDKPDPQGGTYVSFSNRLYLVDYGLVAPVARSKVGDRVRACVHDLPSGCPGDDLRGIGYRVHNPRTGESWVMGDHQHICRGA